MHRTQIAKAGSGKNLVAALLFAVLPPVSALADDAIAEAPLDLPPILKTIEKQGIRIVGRMTVPGGLAAYAAKAGSQPLAIYLTPDNRHVIVGTLVDENGQDMAESQLKALTEASLQPADWGKLEGSTWVQDGNPNAPRVVYTFTDPNCPYCNRFWHAARPWVESGKVQLRHIMVGVIRPDSPAKAAAILEAKSPQDALTRNETTHEEGGISPLPSISATTAASLDANANLMTQLGFGGTPAIIYKNESGTIATVSGLPQGDALETVLGQK